MAVTSMAGAIHWMFQVPDREIAPALGASQLDVTKIPLMIRSLPGVPDVPRRPIRTGMAGLADALGTRRYTCFDPFEEYPLDILTRLPAQLRLPVPAERQFWALTHHPRPTMAQESSPASPMRNSGRCLPDARL